MKETMPWYDRNISEHVLEDAAETELFMCGMQQVSEDDPFHGIYQWDHNLTCTTPVETDYYTTKRTLMAAEGFIRNIHLYAVCANIIYGRED